MTLLEASELKNATKDAMQQTKEAFVAEAKMVAKDMVDLKAKNGRLEGVASGGKTITTVLDMVYGMVYWYIYILVCDLTREI